jgi:hypothetical protein
MPRSRPDLDVELRQELLDRFLRDYDEDRRDGKTVRALHEALRNHAQHDEARFDKLQDRIYEVRQQLARQSGFNQAVTDTGRFILPPVTVNVDQAPRSKRPSSVPPAILKLVSDPKVIAAVAAAVIALSHILRSCVKLP